MSADAINSLPHDKIMDWSELKAFPENKINVIEKLKLVLERVENIVGNGENAGDQHLLIFPQCFLKASFPRSFKVRDCVVKSSFRTGQNLSSGKWLIHNSVFCLTL